MRALPPFLCSYYNLYLLCYMSNFKHAIVLLGHFFFAALFSLALIFFKERQSFDTAHYLFELINTKSFFIAHLRPIAVVSQILPLIGIHLNSSMVHLLMLYSFGDILYYYALFLLAIYYLKDIYCGLAIILTLCVAVTFSFFCPVTELLQGLALLPIFNTVLYRDFRFKKIVITFLLMILVFSHPLLFYPIAVLITYWSLEQRGSKTTFYIWLSFIIICILKFAMLDKYDQQKTFYPVVFNDYGQFKNLTDPDYLFLFLWMFILDLKALVILFILTLIILWKEKKVVIVYLSSIFIFLMIILCTHHFEVVTNYSERMLLPLTSLVVIPFTYGLQKLKGRVFLFASLSLCLLLAVIHINNLTKSAIPFTLRIQQLESICSSSRSLGLQKVIAKDENVEQVPFANTGWCTSIESTLFSSLKGADSCVSIAMQETHINRIKAQGTPLGSTSWIKWTEIILDQNTLNKQYFNFKNELYSSLINVSLDSISPAHSFQLKIDDKLVNYTNALKFIRVNLIADGDRVSTTNLEYQINFYKNNTQELSSTSHYKLESDFKNNVQQLLLVSQNDLNSADKLEVLITDIRNNRFAICKSELVLKK